MTLGLDVDLGPEEEDSEDDDAEEDFFAGAEPGPRDPRDIHVLECNWAALRVHDLCQLNVSPGGAVLGVAASEIESAIRLAEIDEPARADVGRAVRLMAGTQAAILNLRSRRQVQQQRARKR